MSIKLTDIQDIIAYNLKREGYDVLTATRGDQGLSLIQAKNPDLIILDIMLPGIDGLTICQQLRAETKTKDLPIIILSAKEEESDVVIGLGLGADDYIPKPFEEREVLARIRSVLRRQQLNPLEQKSAMLSFNDFTIDFDRHVLLKADVPVDLTSREFALLVVLIEAKNKVLSRDKIMDLLVGRDWFPSDRSVDVLIGRIRKKLGTNPDDPEIIKTVRGAGYLFALKLNRQE